MELLRGRTADKDGLCPSGRWIVVTLLAGLVGCHAPAARLKPLDAEAPPPAPGPVLARQLAADAAVALVYHPLQTGLELTAEPAGNLIHLGRGAVGKRLLMHCHRSLPPLPPCPLDPCVPAAGCWPEEKGLHPTCLRLYPDGAEALAALHRLIDEATGRIDVLMFQWENDALGGAVAAHLAARAGPHLRVRVLVDGAGNLLFGQPSSRSNGDLNGAVRRLAGQPYVEVLRTRNTFGRFDHRKLVLIDGRVAWTGGRNFTGSSFFENHDLSFTTDGPIAEELGEVFERSWRAQGGRPLEPEGRQRQMNLPVCRNFPAPGCLAALGPGGENAWARLLQTKPEDHQIERALFAALDRAQDHIYLENFTFTDSRLLTKLAQARRRGVDVRVVLTLAATPDTINRANRVTANRLFRSGVRVYLCPVMTHLKTAAVDGCWAYLGTGNFDILSLRHNRELGLAVAAGPVLREIEDGLFRPDFRPDWEMTRPLAVSAGDYFWELLSSVCL